MLAKFNTLFDLFEAFPTEEAAVAHLTAIRWANGKFCPLCGNADESRIGTLTTTGQHKCYVCREKFSIKVGTIFQDTKVPLRKWFAAVWLITSHKKGIASTQLAKDIGVTQKTAWFMLHRLRHAARTDSFNAPLDGEVEVDETYVGGKEINRPKSKRKGTVGTAGKTAVIGAVSRKGEVRAKVITRTNTATLDGFVHETVSPEATLVSTDEHSGYRLLSRTYKHEVVRHSAGEYVKGEAHTNSIEGFWSLFKRQVNGTHHWLSPKHLDRYVQEMTFRFNRREMAEGDRANDLLANVEGKRLTYKILTA